MVAHIELSGSSIRVELFGSPVAPLAIPSSSSSPTPEQTLLDTIILVALLVTADADSIPVRRSPRHPTISLPLPCHIPAPNFSREDTEDCSVSDVSSADAAWCVKHSEQLSPRKPRHAFDLRREVAQYCENEDVSYSHLSRTDDPLPPPYTTSFSPTPMYSVPSCPRNAQHFGASKTFGVYVPLGTANRM